MNPTSQVVIFVLMIVLLSNLNAIVDYFLHPAIAYFDHGHLLVGGATGFVSTILIGLIFLYARYLEKALSKIRTLESFLPICANCKKIRIKDGNDQAPAVWQPIESYIAEHTHATLTHGICQECMAKLYPEYIKRTKQAGKTTPVS